MGDNYLKRKRILFPEKRKEIAEWTMIFDILRKGRPE